MALVLRKVSLVKNVYLLKSMKGRQYASFVNKKIPVITPMQFTIKKYMSYDFQSLKDRSRVMLRTIPVAGKKRTTCPITLRRSASCPNLQSIRTPKDENQVLRTKSYSSLNYKSREHAASQQPLVNCYSSNVAAEPKLENIKEKPIEAQAETKLENKDNSTPGLGINNVPNQLQSQYYYKQAPPCTADPSQVAAACCGCCGCGPCGCPACCGYGPCGCGCCGCGCGPCGCGCCGPCGCGCCGCGPCGCGCGPCGCGCGPCGCGCCGCGCGGCGCGCGPCGCGCGPCGCGCGGCGCGCGPCGCGCGPCGCGPCGCGCGCGGCGCGCCGPCGCGCGPCCLPCGPCCCCAPKKPKKK